MPQKVPLKPSNKVIKRQLVFRYTDNKVVYPFFGRQFYLISTTLNHQESDKQGSSLVCVNKPMILRQGLKQSGSFSGDRPVVTRIWPPDCGFHARYVQDTRSAAISQGFLVRSKNIRQCHAIMLHPIGF